MNFPTSRSRWISCRGSSKTKTCDTFRHFPQKCRFPTHPHTTTPPAQQPARHSLLRRPTPNLSQPPILYPRSKIPHRRLCPMHLRHFLSPNRTLLRRQAHRCRESLDYLRPTTALHRSLGSHWPLPPARLAVASPRPPASVHLRQDLRGHRSPGLHRTESRPRHPCHTSVRSQRRCKSSRHACRAPVPNCQRLFTPRHAHRLDHPSLCLRQSRFGLENEQSVEVRRHLQRRKRRPPQITGKALLEIAIIRPAQAAVTYQDLVLLAYRGCHLAPCPTGTRSTRNRPDPARAPQYPVMYRDQRAGRTTQERACRHRGQLAGHL